MSKFNKEACPHCGVKVRQKIFERHITTTCQKIPKPHPYADILSRHEIPEWLRRIGGGEAVPAKIPLRDILRMSCYYPASGLDASPVIILNGFVHSFVYVDYGITREQLHREYSEGGFRGYRLIHHREVPIDDLLPEGENSFSSIWGRSGLDERSRTKMPFADWSIWRRSEDLSENHGPELFSLLFVGAEGVAAFRALYERNDISPIALAIIQPGHAFGGNYTNFFDPNAELWSAIKSAGQLPIVLIEGQYGGSSNEGDQISAYDHDGYRFVKKTKTHQLGRQVYVYNSNGDRSRLLLMLTMNQEEGFQCRSEWIPGESHTIDIFQLTDYPGQHRQAMI